MANRKPNLIGQKNKKGHVKFEDIDGLISERLEAHLSDTTRRKYTLEEVDATQTQTIKLFTTSDRRFCVHDITYMLDTADTVSGTFTQSVGTNASNYDDVAASSVISGLSDEREYVIRRIATSPTGTRCVEPNTDVYLKITGALTATTAIITVHVTGTYEN